MPNANEVFRDFERFTGDGKPGAPTGAPLPIGDPRSGPHNLDKWELRQWGAGIEALNGNPDALNDRLQTIEGRATPSYTSRVAAEAAAADLPTSVTQILVREGTALVIRARNAFADDPLFPTGARWGVVQRQDGAAEAIARQAAISDINPRTTPIYISRAAAEAAASDLPTGVAQIFVQEGDVLTVRARTSSADDPLFSTAPRWGVTGRFPSEARTDSKVAAAVTATGTFRLQNISGANVITASLDQSLLDLGVTIQDGTQVLLTPVARNTASVEAVIGTYPRGMVIGAGGTVLTGGELVPGQTYTLRALMGRWIIVGGQEDTTDASDMAYAIGDGEDYVGFGVTRSGAVQMAGVTLQNVSSEWDTACVDENDYVAFGYRNGAFEAAGITAGQDPSLDSFEVRNRDFSEAVRYRAPSFQLPTEPYNLVMAYGQSLAEGAETWPSLSKVPQPGALMVGENVDNVTESIYTTIGPFAWQPLVARTMDNGANLDAAGEAALPAGSQAKGEPPVIGLTNGLKQRLNRRAMAQNDGRNLVAMSAAVSGKTIAQLSKVNTQDALNRYGGLLDGVSKAAVLAGSQGCVVSILPFLQGEWDYAPDYGSTNGTRALYAAAMSTLLNDLAADVPAITDQSLPPLFMIYQTGAGYTRDADFNGAPGLHVGMAQLDVALSRDDTVMFGPVYPYNDKGGHLDANGSRWVGHQMAKVAAKVMEGEGWQPLRPIEVRLTGASIFVHYHVPVPPLRFSLPYVGAVATDYPGKGYRVTSANGATTYQITGVEIVKPTIIRIDLDTPPSPDGLLWYSSKTATNGNGNVCDSDPSEAIDRFEYVPDRGMYPSANIPALVGRRYSLANWSIAFCLPLTYSEFAA